MITQENLVHRSFRRRGEPLGTGAASFKRVLDSALEIFSLGLCIHCVGVLDQQRPPHIELSLDARLNLAPCAIRDYQECWPHSAQFRFSCLSPKPGTGNRHDGMPPVVGRVRRAETDDHVKLIRVADPCVHALGVITELPLNSSRRHRTHVRCPTDRA